MRLRTGASPAREPTVQEAGIAVARPGEPVQKPSSTSGMSRLGKVRPSAHLGPQVAVGPACWVSQETVTKDLKDRHHGCVPVGPPDGECEQLPRPRGGLASQRREAVIARFRSVEVRGLNRTTIERAAPYRPIACRARAAAGDRERRTPVDLNADVMDG